MTARAVQTEKQTDEEVQSLLRQLVGVWADFESRLLNVPIVDKLNRGKLRLEDYRLLLHDQRQQVVEGARWIAQAAASVTEEYFDIRSRFMQHAVTEHRDFRMLEENYVSVGGRGEDIRQGKKNIGSEALSAWMFHRASQTNPFDLLGAMFIIEGLGRHIATRWGEKIMEQLDLKKEQVSFYLYHGENDEDHMQAFEETLRSGILSREGMADAIVKTARVTARLYLLQLEELGHY